MAEIGFLDIPLEGDRARRLLVGVAAAEPALARVARHLDRLFELRSRWAPGLRFIGAQAVPEAWAEASGDRRPFSLGGCGVTVERALASCLGEAAERLSQVERPGDVTTRSLAAARRRLPASVEAVASDLLAGQGGGVGGLDWVEAVDLGGAGCLLPADWCLRRRHPGPLLVPAAALSIGCAAGPGFEAAAERALLELVERDAAARWWGDGRPARSLTVEQPTMAGPQRLLRALRRDSTGRATRFLDITGDLGIPAVAAVSLDGSGRNFAAGLAARRDLGAAAMAALTELCQMELGLQLAQLKLEQLGADALSADDRRHLERAAGVTADDPRLRAAVPAPPAYGGPGGVAEALARAGIGACLVDLTRRDLAVPVAKAVAPDLQLLPGRGAGDTAVPLV